MSRYLAGLLLSACLLTSQSAQSDPRSTPRIDKVTYIYLAWSGRAFVVRGETLQGQWLDQAELEGELDRIARARGAILYAREKPDQDPPEVVVDNFRLILERGLPLRMTDAVHPGALE